MEQLSLKQIADFCGGYVDEKYADIAVNGIGKDNRNINKGDLFVAICGSNFDGHNFAEAAVKTGAAAALVSKKPENSEYPYVLVENTVTALQKIAAGYRDTFSDLKVVGITGSVGKTTTKEMCAAVLSSKMYTHKTLGNLNIPIILEADIGHVMPQLAIVNGAIINVTSENGKGRIETKLK